MYFLTNIKADTIHIKETMLQISWYLIVSQNSVK